MPPQESGALPDGRGGAAVSGAGGNQAPHGSATESNRQQEEMRARRTSFEAELTHALEDIDAKKKEMWQNGGNRLHDAEKNSRIVRKISRR